MASAIIASIARLTTRLSAPLRRSLSDSSSSSDHLSIEQELDKLKLTLSTIQTIIYDAERKEVRQESVKLWLRELKSIAYDADDVLDEFEYDLINSSLIRSRPTTLGKRKLQLEQDDQEKQILHQPSTSAFNSEATLRFRMAARIKDITHRFDEIAKERAKLQLISEGHRPPQAKLSYRPPTSSFLMDSSEVIGRVEDSRKLIQMLMCEDSDIIPIVGMGGVGKTALAQLVYNDSTIVQHFDTRSWVSVSENLEATSLMRSIIMSVTSVPCDATSLTELQESLKVSLEGKRVLIMLDDVWSEAQVQWEMLKPCLASGADGSKVLITTRIESVALALLRSGLPPYRVSCLSDSDCWSLFRRLAFDGRDPDQNLDLVSIGEMIALKCRGLPLAAKVLGGMLRYETDEETWTEVLESELWNFEEAQDEILPALKLSYEQLPVHLKRCFVFCSVFPKGFVFKKGQLVRLWMVQGFLPSNQGSDDDDEVEDIGSDCFDELIWRSFFEPWPLDVGEEEKFVMHDLLHDLARFISGDEYCRTVDGNLNKISAEETRHLLLIPQDAAPIVRFQAPDEPKALRSLLLIYRMIYSWGGVGLADSSCVRVMIPIDLFSKLSCLRTLDLGYTDIQLLPDSIGNLKHLRYLGLRNTPIRKLPESVCKLYNLQTLDLDYCSKLRELPAGIGNLVNLRHLHLPDMDSTFICIPSGIRNLTGLRELAAFNVGSNSLHCRIEELRDISSIRGDLYISGLRNVARRWDSLEANLKSKKNLQRLTLDWYVHSTDYKCTHLKSSSMSFSGDCGAVANTMPCEHFEEEEMVLDGLQPHPNLVVLQIRHYDGLKFPKWMGDASSLSNLVTVRLFKCGKCEALPALGQLPSLKNLYIDLLDSLQRVGSEFYGSNAKPFAALIKLEFKWLPQWKEWSEFEEGAFPCLEELVINDCPKLRTIPQRLALTLKKLDIASCNQLSFLPTSSSLTSLSVGGDIQQLLWSYTSNLISLETFEIVHVENLTSLILNNLPSLRSLVINSCSQLHSIECQGSPACAASSSTSTASAMGLHNLISLEKLEIEDCPILQFQENEQLPAALRTLDISCCPKMQDWFEGEEGKRQLSLVPEAIVQDFDPDMFQEMIMDAESGESAEEEDMDED